MSIKTYNRPTVTPEQVISYCVDDDKSKTQQVYHLAYCVTQLINHEWDADKALDDIIAWAECHGLN